MSDLLESILRSFKTTIKQLVILLKPFKHTMTLTQAENLLPLHMVLVCNLKLKRALSPYESLVDYIKNYCSSNDNNIDNTEFESEDYEADSIRKY